MSGTSRCERHRAERALQLLEEGRGVLLGQVLDTRSDLTLLRQRHPEQAARFVELRDLLDRPADDPGEAVLGLLSEVGAGPAREHRAADRHELARQFAATTAEIRALDGFASFGLPPSLDELMSAAVHGPIVVFNITEYRSDALALTTAGVTCVPLPDLARDEPVARTTAFQGALRSAVTERSVTGRYQAQNVLTETLEWLWDTAAEPVLHTLGYRSTPEKGTPWPRVWWVPGGLLGLLPLHAAGYHGGPGRDGAPRTVMDRVISSYTPTVRALHHIRRHAPVLSEVPRGLVVAVPTTRGLADAGRLPHVRTEAAMLRGHLPEAVVLLGPDSPGEPIPEDAALPTKDNVLARLPSCPIVHFACHGHSDPADPSRSRLLLHDHAEDPFTVADLQSVRLEGAQLAFLSACRTAVTDVAELADESIHLASAFQLAGFPHVIGTLWEIQDRIAVDVADAFYAALRVLGTHRAAEALHTAVRSARDRYPRIPSLWAAHLHVGA